MNQEQHEMLVRIDERTAALVITIKDHETRIRTMERVRNWFLGIGALITSLFGIHQSTS